MADQTPTWQDVEHAVVVDWKEHPGEILDLLRDRYGDEVDLSSSVLDELVESYAEQPADLSVAAFGQQLTTSGARLYELLADSDDVRLVVVSDAAAQAFLDAAASAGVEVEQKLQPGLEPGAAAQPYRPPRPKRVRKMRGLLVTPLPDAGRYPPRWGRVGDRILKRDLFRTDASRYSWVDHTTWPPEQTPFGAPFDDRRFAVDPHGRAAAASVGDRNGPVVHLLADDLDEPYWRPIRFPDDGPYDHDLTMRFCGDDLFLHRFTMAVDGDDHPKHLWVVRDAIFGARDAELVRGMPDGVRDVWLLEREAGDVWALLDGRAHRYADGELYDTGHFFPHYDATIDTDRGWVFVSGSILGDYDRELGRFRRIDTARLGSTVGVDWLEDGWIVVYGTSGTTPESDVAHLWHQPTDQWRRIPQGLLGKAAVTGALLTPAGRIWFVDDRYHQLIDAGPRDEFIAGLEQIDPAPAEWCGFRPRTDGGVGVESFRIEG